MLISAEEEHIHLSDHSSVVISPSDYSWENFFVFKDSHDYIGPICIIQDNLPVFRSSGFITSG